VTAILGSAAYLDLAIGDSGAAGAGEADAVAVRHVPRQRGFDLRPRERFGDDLQVCELQLVRDSATCHRLIT
jgi:hypothetical protein